MTSYAPGYIEKYKAANGGRLPPDPMLSGTPTPGSIAFGKQITQGINNSKTIPSNSFSQSEVERILGLKPGQATGGYAQRLIDTDPAAKAKYNAALKAGKAPSAGVMPLTIEPLHQFEKTALTALGSNNPGAIRAAGIDPMAKDYLSRFGKYADEAAGMTRAGTEGFNQEEFDQYFNPYTEDVTNRSVSRLSEEAQNMRANLLRQTASNRGNASFGDLYGAQRMGDIDKGFIDKSGDIIASGNQAGFNTALEALFRRRSNQLQGGGQMAGIGSGFTSAAGTAQNVSNAGYEQGMAGLTGQLGSGQYIRNFNQGAADLTFQNMSEPTRFSNALTTSAVAGAPQVQGNGVNYTTPYYDRFGDVAQGIGGAATAASQIKF
jgi:hypothetical protein